MNGKGSRHEGDRGPGGGGALGPGGGGGRGSNVCLAMVIFVTIFDSFYDNLTLFL